MQGPCTRCNKISNLESIGSESLCKPCLIYKYEQYKERNLPECVRFEGFIDNYKRQIDQISPLLNSNLDNINQVKASIEEAYQNQLKNLNNEKNGLLALIEECRKDNVKFTDFKNELNTISQNVNAFKNPTQNLYQDNVVSTLVKRFEESFDKIKVADQNFRNLFSQPVKRIERFDPIGTFGSQKLIGNLSINQQQLPVHHSSSVIHNLSQTFQNTHLVTNPIASNIQNWKQKAADNPYQEINIDKIPSHLASFRNYLFMLNDEKSLSIFSLSSSNDFKHENTFKSPISGKEVRNMAVNLNYIAMTYINIDSKTCKKLNLKPCGLVLFRRSLNSIDFNSPMQIDLPNGLFFKHPVGVALNADHIFVCDQILKSVFKINIQTRQIESQFDAPEGNPYKLSINNEYLVLTDTAHHRISLHKLINLEMINKLDIEQPDKSNGPYGIYMSNDNLIFFKNYQSSQLTVVDMYLNNPAVFKSLTNGIEGFTMMECVQQSLVVGVVDKKNKPKLVCYLN